MSRVPHDHIAMLRELGKELGIDQLEPDSPGVASLKFFDDFDVLLAWEPREEAFLFCASIGDTARLASAETRANCFERLLMANHQTMGASHAAIGLSPDAIEITLSKIWEPGERFAADQMAEALKNYAADIVMLRDTLQELLTASDSGADDLSAPAEGLAAERIVDDTETITWRA